MADRIGSRQLVMAVAVFADGGGLASKWLALPNEIGDIARLQLAELAEDDLGLLAIREALSRGLVAPRHEDPVEPGARVVAEGGDEVEADEQHEKHEQVAGDQLGAATKCAGHGDCLDVRTADIDNLLKKQ